MPGHRRDVWLADSAPMGQSSNHASGWSRLSIFAGLRNPAGDYADACIDRAAILDNNWISGGKHGNVALWVPLRSCNP